VADASDRKINSESTQLDVYPYLKDIKVLDVYPLIAAELNLLKTDCEWSLFNVPRNKGVSKSSETGPID
jgi:hypothetical protein